MKDNLRWAVEFFILIILSMIISGIAFFVQEILNYPPVLHNLVRLGRMALIYGYFAIWFTFKNGGNLCDLGLCLPSKKVNILVSLIGGLLVYQVATAVFISNKIFFQGWSEFSVCETIINLMLIGLMAALTDFWTRGFILLQVSDKFGKRWGILFQNLAWFIIHFYEIQLLQYYIGWGFAILLTLTLGILGDIVALKTRNLYGLMLGHLVLNIQIALVARSVVHTILI